MGGTAGADDHDLANGSIVFEAAEIEKTLAVHIVADGDVEGEETIEVSLTGEGNFGTQRTHTIRVVAGNVAPVTLAAMVSDVNVDDSHTYEWSLPPEIAATGGRKTSRCNAF